MNICAFYALNFATSNMLSFEVFMLQILLLSLLLMLIIFFELITKAEISIPISTLRLFFVQNLPKPIEHYILNIVTAPQPAHQNTQTLFDIALQNHLYQNHFLTLLIVFKCETAILKPDLWAASPATYHYTETTFSRHVKN